MSSPHIEAASTGLISRDSAYAKRHRTLLDHLIALGIETLISVPKVVVVGSQSAGKSSILEALSGISFPRASGTCTRCPSEVGLFYSKTAEWVCEVSLRFEKDAQGKPLENVQTVLFGEPITDPGKVQERLLQAQKAILNPSKPSKSFLHDKTTPLKEGVDDAEVVKGEDEVHFSENVICIKVTSKDVRDLSVVDLPGLIANVGEKEDKRNIGLIKKLAMDTIKKEDCIILSCITMSEDFQNQPSVMLVKEADPSGKRTLGVLTKPDRIEEATFCNWQAILDGKEHRLFHGYYVVKNPTPSELGNVNWEQARANEKMFFQSAPWVGSNFDSRLGADNLGVKLAGLLEQIIKEKMPDIVAKVKALDEKVNEELATLPKKMPEGQQLSHLSMLIRNFDRDLRFAMLDSQEENSLANDLYQISLDFWASMINHRPRFLPLTTSELESLRAIMFGNVCGLKKIKEMRDYIFEEDKAELKARGVKEHKDQKESNIIDDKSLVPMLTLTDKGTTRYGSNSRTASLHLSHVLMTLSDVSSIKARATRDMLPNNTPWSVKTTIIGLCISSWSDVTKATLSDIKDHLKKECSFLVKKHFSLYRVGGLENMVDRVMEKLVNDRVDKTTTFLADLLKLESRYTTIGTSGFLDRQAKVKKEFVAARQGCQQTSFGQPVPLNQANPTPGQTGRAVLEDSVDDELTLVSEVLVYWQIAFKRYTDNVRSAFYTILLQPIADECLEILNEDLGIFGENATKNAKNLLQEDEETAHRRSRLLAQQATLTQSLDVISNFWTGNLKTEA